MIRSFLVIAWRNLLRNRTYGTLKRTRVSVDAFRITIQPMVFILAAVTALLATLATVSVKALRAAMQNPVDSLRIE